MKLRDENAPITDKTDIKILILTFMSELTYPLDSATMSDIICHRDYVNRFDFMECFAELAELGHIEEYDWDGETCFFISPSGYAVAAELKDCLPAAVRTRCSVEAAKILSLREKGAKANCTIKTIGPLKYRVTCTITEPLGESLHLDINVTSENTAKQIKKNFMQKPEHVLRGLLAVMTGEVDFLLS